MAVIQDQAFRLAPGAVATRGFFGWFEPDHPEVTSDADVAAVVTFERNALGNKAGDVVQPSQAKALRK